MALFVGMDEANIFRGGSWLHLSLKIIFVVVINELYNKNKPFFQAAMLRTKKGSHSFCVYIVVATP